MKRFSFVVLCNLFMLCFSVSCNEFHHHGVNIQVSESGHYYTMYAKYDPDETRDVEEYMDYKIGRTSNTSFVNTRIDGELALDDHTTFYIKKYPGYLKIKLDKEKNSRQSYYRIKQMCEGIKRVIAK